MSRESPHTLESVILNFVLPSAFFFQADFLLTYPRKERVHELSPGSLPEPTEALPTW